MRRIQREIAARVILEDEFNKDITSVAGIDIAFLNDLAIVSCITLSYNSLETRFKTLSTARISFPYISTLLSFREAPPIIDLINSIELKADVFLINAHGIAHPFFCGCASYVGVLANIPTIGVASRNLCGEYGDEPKDAREYVPMYYGGRSIGWVFKSKRDCRPIFISPGHLISLKSSLDITAKCTKNHKLPEPLYLAHIVANEEKRKRASQ
jgi:deoxyribonuclease V